MKRKASRLLSPVFFACLILGVFLLTACQNTHVPDDSEVKSAYQKAVEAYGWFELATMETSSDTKEYNGSTYKKVNHATIKTLDDLRNYLLTLFSDEIVDEIFENLDESKQYVDIDGALYTLESSRGEDITKGDETYEITRVNDQKLSFKAIVDIIDPDTQEVTGSETHEFFYELKDGKWVFTNFELVR